MPWHTLDSWRSQDPLQLPRPDRPNSHCSIPKIFQGDAAEGQRGTAASIPAAYSSTIESFQDIPSIFQLSKSVEGSIDFHCFHYILLIQSCKSGHRLSAKGTIAVCSHQGCCVTGLRPKVIHRTFWKKALNLAQKCWKWRVEFAEKIF